MHGSWRQQASKRAPQPAERCWQCSVAQRNSGLGGLPAGGDRQRRQPRQVKRRHPGQPLRPGGGNGRVPRTQRLKRKCICRPGEAAASSGSVLCPQPSHHGASPGRPLTACVQEVAAGGQLRVPQGQAGCHVAEQQPRKQQHLEAGGELLPRGLGLAALPRCRRCRGGGRCYSAAAR